MASDEHSVRGISGKSCVDTCGGTSLCKISQALPSVASIHVCMTVSVAEVSRFIFVEFNNWESWQTPM